MKRELFLEEWKKIWFFPMIPAFLVICIFFNGFLIVSGRQKEKREYVRYVSEVSRALGGTMGAEFDEKAKKLPENPWKTKLISDTEDAVDTLDHYDTARLRETYLSLCRIDGWTADLLTAKYKKLQPAVKLLGDQDAALSLNAGSMTESLMDTLFSGVCLAVITEGILFAVLLALHTTGYEAAARTESVVYATRTGRSAQISKGLAGFSSVLAAYVLLAGSAAGLFAILWRLGPIWDASMSSQFHYVENQAGRVPFLTFLPFTVAGYLKAVLGLGAVLTAVTFFLGFAVGLRFRNGYRGFLVFLTLTALEILAILTTGDSSLWALYELSLWTPVGLWWNENLWFTDMGIHAVVPFQECWTAAFSLLWSLGLSGWMMQSFRRRDL